MDKQEFEKVFAAAAEKSGIAELARKNQFAENLEAMMFELRDKLNSLHTEQSSKEDDLEKEIESYLITNRQYAGGDEEDLWGDDCIRDAIKHGAQWQKEKTINKACEWLQKHMNDYIVHGRDIDFLYDDFREAIEKVDGQGCEYKSIELMNKACEWLRKHVLEYFDDAGVEISTFTENFISAMEDE